MNTANIETNEVPHKVHKPRTREHVRPPVELVGVVSQPPVEITEVIGAPSADRLRGNAGTDLAITLGASAVPAALGLLALRGKGRLPRLLRLPVALGVLAPWAYLLFMRPREQHWGATNEEVATFMPGDDEVAYPDYETTYAVTINAPASEVWPWLVQMGYGRAGFYTYDWMDRLLGLKSLHSADRIIPELQRLKVGDHIPQRPGFGWPLEAIEPGRLLMMVVRLDGDGDLSERVKEGQASFTWVFLLKELNGQQTRLIVRSRGPYMFKLFPPLIIGDLILDPGGFIMQRGMMLGIKNRAERAWAIRAMQTAEGMELAF